MGKMAEYKFQVQPATSNILLCWVAARAGGYNTFSRTVFRGQFCKHEFSELGE